VTDSVRSALEAAVEASEQETSAPVVETPVVETPEPSAPAPSDKEAVEEVVAPSHKPDPKVLEAKPGVAPEAQKPGLPADEAPKSWKAGSREAWKAIPTEAKQEIIRREREIERTIGTYNEARILQRDFNEAVSPFMARIRSAGFTPVQAVSELMKADHILSTAAPASRAQYMATLIKEYAVDIRELDAALAGEPAADPVASRVEQMLAEKFAPLQQFVNQQRQTVEMQQAQQREAAGRTIQAMSEDTVKYPFFEEVRADMADIIDAAARRGVEVGLEEAYRRATYMNPDVSTRVIAQNTATAQQTQAQATTARTQRALAASASVSGAPSGTPLVAANLNGAGNLRDSLEAAFQQVGGR
jgi:DNA-binding ferritin-like protein